MASTGHRRQEQTDHPATAFPCSGYPDRGVQMPGTLSELGKVLPDLGKTVPFLLPPQAFVERSITKEFTLIIYGLAFKEMFTNNRHSWLLSKINSQQWYNLIQRRKHNQKKKTSPTALRTTCIPAVSWVSEHWLSASPLDSSDPPGTKRGLRSMRPMVMRNGICS